MIQYDCKVERETNPPHHADVVQLARHSRLKICHGDTLRVRIPSSAPRMEILFDLVEYVAHRNPVRNPGQNGGVAQLVEYDTFNVRVRGSNPLTLTRW